MKITELKALIKEEVKKALSENTMVDFANYYRAYDSDVKQAAKALDKIIEESGAGSEELFDAITDLVDAVRADRDIEESVLKEAYYDFEGTMLVDLTVGGKSHRYPFSNTPEVKLKKGQKVILIMQDNLYQFLDYKTGKHLGSIWKDDMDDDIKDIVNY